MVVLGWMHAPALVVKELESIRILPLALVRLSVC
jgi:hypothetical protein